MECISCPGKEYDILYRCRFCDSSVCDTHLDTTSHHCKFQAQNTKTQPKVIQIDPFSGFSPFSGHYTESQARREPESSKKYYERILRSNPQVLTTGKESYDLFFGFLLITFVISSPELFGAIIFGRFNLDSLLYILMISIIVAPAFILHELGHKYAA
jgi:hypothetical protein